MNFRPRFATLVDVLDLSVGAYADRPLFGTKRAGAWRFSTYAELGRRVARLRSALEAVGVTRGDRVGIISRNRPEWAVTAYAAYCARAAVVAMYETQTDEELSYVLEDAGVKVLFVADTSLRARVTAMRARLPLLETVVVFDGPGDDDSLSFDAMFALGAGHDVQREAVEPDDIASILYTSGTTGRPKGVMLSHGNIAHNVSALHQIFPISPEDRSLSILPWAHVFGQTVELHGLMSLGGSIAIASSIEDLPRELVEVQPSLLFGFPKLFASFYDRLLSEVDEAKGLKRAVMQAALDNAVKRRDLARERKVSGALELKHMAFERLVFEKARARFGGRLRYAFSGGAALPRRVAELVDNLGILLYEGYGLTETAPIISCNFPGSRKIGSAGKPLPGLRVEVDTSVTDDPKLGEIVVFGPSVMQGYRGMPEADAEVFVEREGERGLRTGDLGYLDGEGYLHIEGRVTEQYRLVTGRFVIPTPLEETLKLSHFISNVMVFGEGRAHNVALIVPDFRSLSRWAIEREISGHALRLIADPRVRELYRAELSRYSEGFRAHEKIHDFALIHDDFTVANGLLTATQKVRRGKVTELYRAEIEALYGE